MKISAEIIAHTKRKSTGEELITYKITFPRFILAEINKHRMLTNSTSSHRAVKLETLIESLEKHPFIPYAWQKRHRGMQGTIYEENENEIKLNENEWLIAMDNAIRIAKRLDEDGDVTKQLCNRLLEPFSWSTMVITGMRESFNHMFELRCPSYNGFKSWKELSSLDSNYPIETPLIERLKLNKGQAEIHFSILAEMMYDLLQESKPKVCNSKSYHIPYEALIDEYYPNIDIQDKLKVSAVMCARTSYTMIEDPKNIPLEKQIGLYHRLIEHSHLTPVEHIARVMSDVTYNSFVKGKRVNGEFPKSAIGWCGSYKGFQSLRYKEENK